MDFKYYFTGVILYLLFISFNQTAVIKSCSVFNNQIKNEYHVDTFSFNTSGTSMEYIAQRLYSYDEENPKIVNNLILLSANGYRDSLMLFFQTQDKEEYNDLIPISDSLVVNKYARDYKVTIDDDVPFFLYLENDKDWLTFSKNIRTGDYYLVKAIIQDTIVSILNRIKPGMTIQDVYLHLNLPEETLGDHYSSIMIFDADKPSGIWYKNESFYYESKSSILVNSILIKFRNKRIISITIDSHIGYDYDNPLRRGF